MINIRDFKLSQIKERLEAQRFPGDSDLRQIDEMRVALANYGDITYGEYQDKKRSSMTDELIKEEIK